MVPGAPCRWVFMSLQPAEFIKLTTVLILAVILSRTQLKKSPGLRNRGIIYAASVVIGMSALLFTQGLTNTLLLMVISMSMMLIGAIEWKKVSHGARGLCRGWCGRHGSENGHVGRRR